MTASEERYSIESDIHLSDVGSEKRRLVPLVLLVVSFLILLSSQVGAQTGLNVDSLFSEARQLARAGERAKARQLCQKILQYKPGYHDVRVYLGRLYAWDKQYDQARRELNRVLVDRPTHREALNALVDVEMWAKEYRVALIYVDRALKTYPNDQDFLYKKALILVKLGRNKEAARQLTWLLRINPAHEKALRLMKKIRSSAQLNKIAAKYAHDRFSREGSHYGPWHMAAIEYARRTPIGSVFLRGNYAYRTFSTSSLQGFQVESDAYPKFFPGVYSYLNVGFSGDKVFPRFRLGAEPFVSLGKGYEMSLGLRYLKFTSREVVIYTGSLGKYYRNYWFSLRPYMSQKDAGLSVSGHLFIRRYFGNADSFVNLIVGMGSTPVEVSTIEEIDRLDSKRFSFLWQKLWEGSYITRFEIGFEREEYRLNRYGNRYFLRMDIQKRF